MLQNRCYSVIFVENIMTTPEQNIHQPNLNLEADRAPLLLRAAAAVGNAVYRFAGVPDPAEVLAAQLAQRQRIMNAADAVLGDIDSALSNPNDSPC